MASDFYAVFLGISGGAVLLKARGVFVTPGTSCCPLLAPDEPGAVKGVDTVRW